MLENTDKLLCEETIKSLISYAEHLIWNKANSSETNEIRDLVETMEGYWGLDAEKDWVKQFDENIQKAEEGNKPEHLSEKQQSAAINGLYRYAMEMTETQGLDATAEIGRVQTFLKRLGNEWKLPEGQIHEVCCTIHEALENMQNQPKMGMEM